jgi:hypothetical protein
MVKQSLSVLIAVSMALCAPMPVLAKTEASAKPPPCVATGDPILSLAWNADNPNNPQEKEKIHNKIRQACIKKTSDKKVFKAELQDYLDKLTEATYPDCANNPNCPNRHRGAERLDVTGKDGPIQNPPPRRSEENLNDNAGRREPRVIPGIDDGNRPIRTASTGDNTGFGQNLMWGLGGALLGGVVGYMMGNGNRNNGYYNQMMYPQPWMQRSPYGMYPPPFLPLGQQPMMMNRFGMGGMMNPNAPAALPLFPGGGISPLGGYGNFGNLGGYGGLGGIGGMPNYYMPGQGQISTGLTPPILPQYPSVPAYSTMLRPPILGGY